MRNGLWWRLKIAHAWRETLKKVKAARVHGWDCGGYFLSISILNSSSVRILSILEIYHSLNSYIRTFNVLTGQTRACKYNERRLKWGAHPGSPRAICDWDIVWKLEQLDSTPVRGMAAWIRASIVRA
jgi:hypothetical protein